MCAPNDLSPFIRAEAPQLCSYINLLVTSGLTKYRRYIVQMYRCTPVDKYSCGGSSSTKRRCGVEGVGVITSYLHEWDGQFGAVATHQECLTGERDFAQVSGLVQAPAIP
ncbi:unnamed protein product [Sphagnum jensenii]|uniref:Uncharacterized protein n=1 Tax=Sphagnum jensenii TaxID=128206 RepID=A0ABP0WKJ9_9BRYO